MLRDQDCPQLKEHGNGVLSFSFLRFLGATPLVKLLKPKCSIGFPKNFKIIYYW
jgi:hypothetical protein